MHDLYIDIETYSSEDLPKCGPYRYSEAKDFTVLLFAYSLDGAPVKCIDLTAETLPEWLHDALASPDYAKHAHNAVFERLCLSRMLGRALDPAQWHCTAVLASRWGLPRSLGDCAKVLRLTEGKMDEGRKLIRKYCKPNKQGVRNVPTTEEEREEWRTFKAYCVRDVEVEMAIADKLQGLDIPETERALYIADQHINDRGVLIDLDLVNAATKMNDTHRAKLLEQSRELTGLDNPNSTTQLKAWLRDTCRMGVDTLNKASLSKLMPTASPLARRVLGLRAELGKTSTAKYKAMIECVCLDNRVHGLLQFYGASRTGRWAGRLVQVQNLPQNHMPDLDHARNIVRRGDLDEIELMYDSTPRVLSELIRTAFVAPEGCTLQVCDFSAIEARVIAWLAGEEWVLDVFRSGGDIYCATASQMFGVPVEKHGQNAELRPRGKVSVLALGYGGSVAALEAMGGARLGLSEAEMEITVTQWRKANPRIVRLWRNLNEAATQALQTGREIRLNRGLVVSRFRGMLRIVLPSGRSLMYPRAKVEQGIYGAEITYEGQNQTTGQWETLRTYGGKLTENVVQAIARDILAEVLLRLDAEGARVVFHVHDEVVVEVKKGTPLAKLEKHFANPPSWCQDMPLSGAGYETPYYKKD